ncbi:MAG: ABC transporter permease [Chlamydiae bacterium]|nr:ABC transporter permease [Chlamydiota bacterium]
MSWLSKHTRVKALIVKEFFQILRDPSSLIIATVFPLFLLFMYGFGISLDVKKLNVGLVQQDFSDRASSFVCSLKDSPFFNVIPSYEPSSFYKPLAKSEIDAIVWIPFYFSEYWEKASSNLSDTPASIYVISDGSSPNTATFAQNYIKGAWSNWQNQMKISSNTPLNSPINIVSRFWFNEDLDSHYFLVPGSIAIVMTLLGTLLTALMIAREWERGTMEALMATPVTIAEILLSKLIPYFLLGMISMAICTLVGHYIFDIPFRGSFTSLSIVSFFFLIVALGTGLLISSISKDQFTAAQISIISAFLPAFMLSGFIFEIQSMPLLVRVLSYFLPARYFVSCLQTLFLAGDIWPLLLKSCLILSLFSIVLTSILVKKTKKRLD